LKFDRCDTTSLALLPFVPVLSVFRWRRPCPSRMFALAPLRGLVPRSRVPESFLVARAALAILLSLALLVSTLWAASSAVLGTVVFADRARVGDAGISAGATVFSGDRLSTDHVGTVQVRVRAAR